MTTQDGKNFLVQALDPNHDFERTIVGYPDIESAQTVIQKIKKQFTIKAPAGVAGNWDAHIFTLPELVVPKANVMQSLHVYGTYEDDPNVHNGSQFAQPTPVGPVVWHTVDAGVDTLPGIQAGAWNPTHHEAFVCDINDFLSNPSRLVGFAIEVHNTTSEINKQGTVTCYRMPQDVLIENSDYNDGVNGDVPNLLYMVSRMPPSTVDQAMLLKGTTQWEAAEGAYAVVTMSSLDQPLRSHTHAVRSFEVSSPIADGSATPVQTAFFQSEFISNGNLDFFRPAQCEPVNYNTSGIYFTGLSLASTLTLTVTFILESAPVNDPKLLVLAQPSPSLDMEALTMYSKAIRELPPAVKAKMNAAGDFFRSVLKIIKTYAPKIGSLSPDPRFQLLANAIGTGADMVSTKLEDSDRKRIEKAKKQILTRISGDGKRNLSNQFKK